MFLGACVLALRTVLRVDRVGRAAIAGFLCTLLLLSVGNLLGPPPSARVVVWSALGLWLLVPWAEWLDRRAHRPVIDESRPGRHT